MLFGDPSTWTTAVCWWIVPAVIADTAFPPIPSEILLITAGSLTAENPSMLWLPLLLGSVGSWIGEVLLFLLFRRRLTHLLDRWGPTARFHTWVRRTVERTGSAPAYSALVGARFLPGGRLATSVTAGIAQVQISTFVWLSALGSVCWASWLVGIGYVTAHTTRLPFWASSLLGTAFGLLIGALAAALIAWRRRRAQAAATDTTNSPLDGDA